MTDFPERETALERPSADRNERALALQALGAFMGRYWRGEERLWKAYWVFGGVGVTVAAYVVGLVRGVVLESQMWIGVGLIFWGLALAGALAYQVWVCVAIWRGAFNVGWKGWGYVCRAVVAVYAVGLVFGLIDLMAQWGELL